MRKAVAILLAFVAVFLCSVPVSAEEGVLRLATTTSTENSGLLNHLLPTFEAECECTVQVLPVGSGRALKSGEFGDVDVVMVHSPRDEEAFVAAGYGIDRRAVMHNDFVLLGPPGDPAGIAGSTRIIAGLRAISDVQAPFVSRGDNSGTYRKEEELWEQVKRVSSVPINFEPSWHLSAGTGMGQAILVADQKEAYILSDRGTFLFFQDKVDLEILIENEPRLNNPYTVITVNPARHPHINAKLAKRFSDWIVSETAQNLIAGYRVKGEQLFFVGAR